MQYPHNPAMVEPGWQGSFDFEREYEETYKPFVSLILIALVVGVGFNIKKLEAFLVLPAFYLLYLVAAPVGWQRRMIHLGLATVVIVKVTTITVKDSQIGISPS